MVMFFLLPFRDAVSNGLEAKPLLYDGTGIRAPATNRKSFVEVVGSNLNS